MSDVDSTPREEQRAQARDLHGIAWFLVVSSLISATFIWGLDGTVVADIQASFVADFHSIDKLAWNSVAFFLGAASAVLSWGQCYGQFDAKWVFILCVAIFEIGTAVCGAAQNQETLIAGRAISGVGGAGMYAGVLTLLSLLTTEKERALYMAIPGLTWGLGTVLGPVIGGALAESKAKWRTAFWLILAFGGVCAPVYLFMLPSRDVRPDIKFKEKLREIDFIGFALLTGITTTFLAALCFGGLVHPWHSATIITLFVVAAVLSVIFAVQQVFSLVAKSTVVPVSILSQIRVMMVFILETCSATACFLPCYFIPLHFQYVLGDGPLMAGVRLLPFITFMVGTVILGGALVSKTGRWSPWFFYGSMLVLAGGAAMAFTVDEHTKAGAIYGFSILIGSGSGAYIQLPFSVAQQLVDPSLIPAAVGLITYAQLAAPAVTLSVANSAFLNRAQHELRVKLPKDAPILEAIAGVNSKYIKNLDDRTRQLVIHEIVQSMRYAYHIIFAAGLLSLVLSFGLLVTKRSQTAAEIGNESADPSDMEKKG